MSDASRAAAYRRRHPDRAAAACARWRARNKDRVKEWQSRADAKRHHKRTGAAGRALSLWQRYKLTPEAYEAMVASQNGVCAACGGPPDKGKLFVDHVTVDGVKRVRGLLCDMCNKTLGHVADEPSRLLALANTYIPWIRKLASGELPRPVPRKYWPSYAASLRSKLIAVLGERCMACRTSVDLCADHDHAPGAGRLVRGLLCRGCNTALGYAREDAAWLVKLAEYAKRTATTHGHGPPYCLDASRSLSS